jgi:hypothetical protein
VLKSKNASSAPVHVRKLNLRIFHRQKAIVARLLKVSTLLIIVGTTHATEPRYFHIRVSHPSYARIVKALHQLEKRQGGVR